jgi:DNA-binding CsgD family transcriptional regulator/PAS domain-containing protein
VQNDIGDLALGLYEALLDGDGLMPALGALAGRIRASSHAMHLIRYRNGKPVGSVSTGQGGVAGPALDEYARRWVRHDPWAQVGATLPPGVHDIARLVPPDVLRRSALWQEWGRPNDAAFHAIGVPLMRRGDSIGGVFFHRRESEPPFDPRELSVMEAMFPHLRRVFAAEAQFAAAQDVPGVALRAGLDALPEGVAVIDEARRLLFANAALERMAAERDGLSLGPQGLDVQDPALRVALGRAVTAALAAANGQVGLLPMAGTLGLTRPSGRAPWMVRALPLLRGEARELPAGFRGAMLLVSDGERRGAPAAAVLGRLFALTPAEAALAASLAAGQSLEQHATRRGISRETARSQMAAIRRKTGCRRQADLAALLARVSR